VRVVIPERELAALEAEFRRPLRRERLERARRRQLTSAGPALEATLAVLWDR